ncbi:MAG: protein kinase [Myxococcales bacterium]|nr:protein kinase [Myxococcales bacterium]
MTLEVLDTLPVAPDGSSATQASEGGSTGPVSVRVGGREPALPSIDPRRYVIREELARGGMGKVSIAFDTALGRLVAIKELLVDTHGHAGVAARFRRELALTARLQHPSIVGIMDGGTWTAGEPVYVMRLVQGESLDKTIARATTTAARLALLPHMIAVVDALAYAHAQRIIHRDLKPANVLVGELGETVVIDWGIAKDLDRPEAEAVALAPFRDQPGDAHTMAGAVLGTPAYMPPEQALGEPVDARADVYALGAVLYQLLTGNPPHRGRTLEAIVVSVLHGPPPPLPDDVPPDLAAIVRRAMAREVGDRYPSAGELALDLKRFHAGQLVGAHAYGTWHLIKRWVRRHRGAVGVGAIAAVVLAAFAAVSVSRIVKEQERSSAAELVAEASRHDAEHLLDFMLVELRDKLAPIGKLDLLRTVAAEAHGYYERREPTSDLDDQHRRVLVLRNLGEVHEAQGELPAALGEFRESLTRAEALVASAPERVAWRLDLAIAHRRVAGAIEQQGDLPAALRSYRQGLAIALGGPPDDGAWQGERSSAQIAIGDVLRAQGDFTGAIETYRGALTDAVPRVKAHPEDATAVRDAELVYNKLGTALRTQPTPDLDGAIAQYREAQALADRLVSRDPTNVVWQRDLSIVHGNLGRVFKARKAYAEALAEYQVGVTIAEALAARDPLDANAQRDLAISINVVSKVQLEQHDYPSALAGYRRSLAIREQLAIRDPSNALWQHDLSVNHYMVGDVLEDQGSHAEALATYKTALALAEIVAARDRTNASWQEIVKELRETTATCCGQRPAK